jgi:phosphotriesterase-related protein
MNGTRDESSAFIQTVLGPISPEELGTTLMHEHLVLDRTAALGHGPRLESPAAAARILECLKQAEDVGVTALVDPAPIQGASPLLLTLVALQTPIRIICVTGLPPIDTLPLPGWAYMPAGSKEIAAAFVRDATEGREGSGVKPGMIKVGSSGRAISEVEENMLRGAVLAQQATGLAIMSHTHFTRFAEEQVAIFEDAGADLDRVVIAHIGWGSGPDDFPLHERLVKRGVMIELDLIGSPARSDEEYARIALDLIEAGYASQMLFSHDAVIYPRGLEGLFSPEWCTGDLTVVHRRFIPLLQQAGVDDATIHQIMVDNPRRVLTVDPERYPGAHDTLLAEVSTERPWAELVAASLF